MRTVIIFSIILLIVTLISIKYPYSMVNPGTLQAGHQALQSDCMACHTVLHNAPDEKCLRCHVRESIGRMKVNGQILEKVDERSNLIHSSLAAGCVDCHSEHNGGMGEKPTQRFSHTFLGAKVMDSCLPCHAEQRPGNVLHNKFPFDCKQCHATNNWRMAQFNHSFVGGSNANCADCHKEDTPQDALHEPLKNTPCQQCHSVEYWKPTNFDHSRYFTFDENHPSDCANCHNVSSGLKTYTCYNCHEHSAARIAEKHQEEGINSFENCVKCHRSGNEHDIRGEGGREGGEHESRGRERKSGHHGEHGDEGDDD